MSRAEAILATLIGYKVLLIVIGLWASRRTHTQTDFFLGGRRLGPVVAAISASASSSSAWTLLGVSGAAYLWGLSAVWLFPATLLGFLINWYWVAPRLHAASHAQSALTLSEFVAGDHNDPLFPLIMRVASLMVVFSFVFYISAQFQAAGHAFSTSFGLARETSILIGVAVIVVYTLLGGFWAVSVTDTVQGLMMAATAILLPLVALVGIGGFDQLLPGLKAVAGDSGMNLTGPFSGALGLAFVLGTLGIGLGYPGQPHVVNRFMALRDQRALKTARRIAVGWAVVIYAGMLLTGLCGRILYSGIADGEQVFFEVANRMLSPVMSGVMIAAVLSAVMSTADSQLLVAASSSSYDWNLHRGRNDDDTRGSRWVVLLISAIAVLIALFVEQAIFARVLFAWHAMGSSFGPVLIARLAGRRPPARVVLTALCTGFGLTVVFHLLPDTPGDALERLVPFFLALAIVFYGSLSPRGR